MHLDEDAGVPVDLGKDDQVGGGEGESRVGGRDAQQRHLAPPVLLEPLTKMARNNGRHLG